MRRKTMFIPLPRDGSSRNGKAILKPALALAAVLAVLAYSLPAAPQGAPPAGAQGLETRIASILARFPAESAAARDALCAEILGLGPRAVGAVCARV
ncbi:MAG TPA: hypothetical protein ENO03_01315, partial [Candidatus Aminicenantes bacterium]|nr:hypothetical protein [Candidatus Aminicenantes bacterium]